jgi:uncharacterized protein involved in response to NO
MPAALRRRREYAGPTLFSYGFRPFFLGGHTIPALATGQFDLIEFFRHGHTKLDGVLTQEESAAILAD